MKNDNDFYLSYANEILTIFSNYANLDKAILDDLKNAINEYNMIQENHESDLEQKKKILEDISKEYGVYGVNFEEAIKGINDNQANALKTKLNNGKIDFSIKLGFCMNKILLAILKNMNENPYTSGIKEWYYQIILLWFKYNNFIKEEFLVKQYKKYIKNEYEELENVLIENISANFGCDQSSICIGDYDGKYKIVDGEKVCYYTCILGNADFEKYSEIVGLGDLKLAISINLKGSNIAQGFTRDNNIYVLGNTDSINYICEGKKR